VGAWIVPNYQPAVARQIEVIIMGADSLPVTQNVHVKPSGSCPCPRRGY
jgi:hypothetical protein